MTISEDVLKIWMREVKKYLHRYWSHSHYDDIVAEAYLTMWEALSRAPEGSVRDVKAYAMRAAWNGAQAYLSSPANEQRTYNVFHKTECTPGLSLEGVIAGYYPEWAPHWLRQPDFVPALIERLAAEDELAKMKPARRAALLLCAYHGYTRYEAMEQLGFSRTKIDKLLCGISREAIPYTHPIGGRPDWTKRQRGANGQFL